ncbi:TonB family protein [Thermomonas sp. HDW16]|uniref:energy transducer TonB n=1 Tax=Thermomonas sp. HDW16 TaxID=2714945 RepID=UPI001408A3E7|nr:TonB family protein [Thermomonas sp. HDW16]QIL19917.1 TonB family protein [Thermomonas sp. HDW16]
MHERTLGTAGGACRSVLIPARTRGAHWWRRVALLAAAGALGGCASPAHKAEPHAIYAADGAVSAAIVDVLSEQRYQVVAGTSYLQPIPRRANAKPEYPAALLDRQLPPLEVVVRIVVGGKGTVDRAWLLDGGGGEQAFADAVLRAVQDWTFVPLMQVTGDKAEPLPFTQDYRITFRQVNGRAIVDSGSLH